MGVLTIEDKLIQVDMLRLEVGSNGLRADVPHEREREMRKLLKGMLSMGRDVSITSFRE